MSHYRPRAYSLGDSPNWHETPSGLVIPSSAAPAELPIGVDLFAGTGGMSLGFHQAGFHVAAAAEADIDAAATYLVNLGSADTLIHVLDRAAPGSNKRARRIHEQWAGQTVRAGDVFESAGLGWITSSRDHEPGTCAHHIDDPDGRVGFCDTYHAAPAHRLPCEHFYFGDVRDLTGGQILDDLGVDQVDCVFGGPPCQGFSKANGKSNDEKRHDPRNLLVFEFARLVLETHAKTMVMENVPQIVNMHTAEGVPVIDALARVLADGGFSTYDALRKSLRANAGAGGALRRDPHNDTGELDDEDDIEPAAQPSLFDAVGASA